MKPEELQRSHLTALIAGTPDEAGRIRRGFQPPDHETAARYLRAAVAACLEYHFGPGAGLGAGPVDHDAFTAFMAEMRGTGPGAEPRPDYLAIESAVRSLYGEPHLFEPLDEHQRTGAHYALLRKQIDAHSWLAANPGHLVDRAAAIMTTWTSG